ncbi:MAG: TetR/AcrR family transcriptional regulator [Streptosporangiaceae bacterium]|jgi:AcrR family transcriptional regulator
MTEIAADERSAQPMRADAQRSRAKLLAAATTAFMEKGANAPLEDIARQAGVGIGTLYRHFPTRLDLQEAVFRGQVQAVCLEGEGLIDWPSPGEAFANWTRALANYMVTKRGLASALVAADGTKAEVISNCSQQIRTTAEHLLVRAKEAGEIRQDLDPAEVLMLLHGVIVATERTPEQADRLMSLLLDGMRPRDLQHLQRRRTILIRGGEHDGGPGRDTA